MPPYAISLLILSAVMFVGLLILVLSRRGGRRRSRLAGLSAKVGGGVPKSGIGGTVFSGRHAGGEFDCRYFPGSKDAPPSLTILLHRAAAAPLTVTVEGGFDRLGKKIGLASELQTGLDDFDRRYYFDTEQEDLYRDYWHHGERRTALQALFGAGYKLQRVKFSKEGLAAVVCPLRSAQLETFPVQLFLDNLAVLGRGLPEPAPAGLSTPVGLQGEIDAVAPRRRAFALLCGLTGLLFVAGLASLIVGLTAYKPLGASLAWRSLGYSLPAFALFLWFAFQALKGRSSSHKRYLFLFLFGIGAFVLAGSGAMIYLNGRLDARPARVYRLPLLDKHVSRSKDSLSYHIIIRGWQPAQPTRHLSVRHSLYDGLQPGDLVRIAVKPGRFGQEWLRSVAPAESEARR